MNAHQESDAGLDLMERVTLGRRIAEVIRADILFGRIQPGTRLAQQHLCERFGVSRMPVRDALRQLIYEGYLVRDSGRHCLVAHLRRQDIIDTFAVEGMLHGFAARRVAETASPDQLDELERQHHAMVASEHDLHQFATMNWAFHRRINTLAQSRKLIAAIKTLAMAMPRDFVTEFPEWVPTANAEHEAIVAAFQARDGSAVEALMHEHVGQTGVKIADYLERKGVSLG